MMNLVVAPIWPWESICSHGDLPVQAKRTFWYLSIYSIFFYINAVSGNSWLAIYLLTWMSARTREHGLKYLPSRYSQNSLSIFYVSICSCCYSISNSRQDFFWGWVIYSKVLSNADLFSWRANLVRLPDCLFLVTDRKLWRIVPLVVTQTNWTLLEVYIYIYPYWYQPNWWCCLVRCCGLSFLN